MQFLRRPECYNKLLISRAGEGEGRQGEEAGAKRPENLKDGVGTPAESAPGAAGASQGVEEDPGRVNAGDGRLGRRAAAKSIAVKGYFYFPALGLLLSCQDLIKAQPAPADSPGPGLGSQ